MIEVGSFESSLSGESLCLPYFLLLNLRILVCLCHTVFWQSGAIKNGCLESCFEEGLTLPVVSRIWQRCSAFHIFLSSEKEFSAIHFRLAPEVHKDDAWKEVERKLREDGVLNLNFATARIAQLKSLEIEVKQRSIKLEDVHQSTIWNKRIFREFRFC